MRNDADFVAYVAARWPFLVRTLVMSGCPGADAERIVRTALARCYVAWEEVLGSDDVDVSVYGLVLEGWHRSLRHRPPAEVSVPQPETVPAEDVPGEVPDDVPDAVQLRRALEAQLARLEPLEREVLVLRFVAGLSEVQVADLLDTPVGEVRAVRSPAPPEDFRIGSGSIDVLSPPFDRVIAEAGAQRRRHLRIVLASVVAAVLAVGAVGWLTTRPPPAGPSELDWAVVRQPNPVDLPWYAGGELHLAGVTVRMGGIGDLVAVDDGAVFTDEEGAVYFAAADGGVTELGHTDAGARVGAADQTDWVAWVDVSSDEPRLVVHNLVSELDFATLALPEGGQVVAVDQARVFFTTPGGDFMWQPSEEQPVALDRSGLLDVRSGTQVYDVGDRIDITQLFFTTSHVLPGTGARVSPGGSFVLSRGGDGSVPFRPLLYDARTGERMRSGLAADELALDATFGPNHTMSYLVAPRADLAGGPDLDGNSAPLVVLRSCVLAPVVCHDVIPLARPDEQPLLAR